MFVNVHAPNWSEEVFAIKKVKTCVVDMKKETNQKEFRIEKVIKKKDNKLDVKWKD